VPFEQIKASRYWNRWVEVSARHDEIDLTLAKEAGTPGLSNLE
jgi:hypothetical protein